MSPRIQTIALQFLQCEFCDGFPSFDDVHELRQHHLEDHIKIDIIFSSLTSVKAILDLRNALGIEISSKHDKENCDNSSMFSSTLTPLSSRSSSPTWHETSGSRPPVGEQPMEVWAEGKPPLRSIDNDRMYYFYDIFAFTMS